MLRRIVSLALCVCAMASMANLAGAQSFGRNKVHYDDLDFRVLQTRHFDIYYYPAEHAAALDAARLAERWYDRLSARLDDRFETRQPIVLYASHAQFAQTNVVSGALGDGVGGVTDQDRGRIVLPFAVGLGETDHVLGHELVHAFQRDILKRHGRTLSSLPLWFTEGMAEYVSIGGIDSNTAMWLRDASASDRLPRIDQLDDPGYFPYRFGQALWAFLADRYGDNVVAGSLTSKARGNGVSRLIAITGRSSNDLTAEWHEWIRRRTAVSEEEPSYPKSRPIVTASAGGRLNVAPALSPDGKSIVYLSENDQYSIDVFLANAVTGTVSRKLVETAADPHFDSLQFIESAGGWDPSGHRFALAALAGGSPVLSIFNTKTGSLEREYPIHGIDQLFGPTWSPDGRRVAFSAMAGGYSDLYVLDLQSGRVQALTRDAFADVQPAWSPDGRTIAFATDRFSSSLETLSFGRFRLATIDVDTAVVRDLPSVPSAKNIDPHWSYDGSSLYFVADGDEVSNVYRLDVARGDLFKVTTEKVGVSGVTALSPALSVAGPDDRLAFSVYHRGSFEIHTKSVRNAQQTTLESDVMSQPVVPFAPAPLVRASSFSDRPYRAALSLDRYVQPYITAGGSSIGTVIRGGVGLSFADTLGNHRVDVDVQSGIHPGDGVVQAGYMNVRSRWNWGMSGGQIPWQQRDFRQIHREISGTAIYPFSAARRLELAAGVESVGVDRQTAAAQLTGTTFVESGAALVYDTSTFGVASPASGQRYRLSVSSAFGGVAFTTVNGDYRRYFMPIRPMTIAVRVMDTSRFGSGADDPRLLPLAWTLRDVVRGYGDAGAASSYVGATNMLIGNVELRLPVRSAMEALVFGDAGSFGSRQLRSTGAGVRFVAAGVVFEVDGVRTFDQLSHGWTFSFNFRPGF